MHHQKEIQELLVTGWCSPLPREREVQHNSTKCTPFLLMYGREGRLPIDITLQASSESKEEQEVDLETKVECMLEMLHENALTNIQKAQANQYDAKHILS